MIVTVTCSTENERDIELICNNPKFKEKYNSSTVRIDGKYLYRIMFGMTEWANNELKEELLFEVE